MYNLKKLGIIVSSSVLSLGMFSSISNASTVVNGQPEKVQIQIASTETMVSKNDLIKKFHSLFPNQFDFLTNSDFHMSSGHFYPDDDKLRYDLSFSKVIKGKPFYGNVGFVGEDLEIEQFSYQPPSGADSLFPAKVSKEEAKIKAVGFIKNFFDGADYQIEEDSFNYSPTQILTEPIRYSFAFTRTENQISISDQRIDVTVLGNGEIVGFYRSPVKKESSTFDDVTKIKDANEILKNVKENLSVDLQYQLNHDYQTGDRSVQLVYQPNVKIRGIHATSGKWLTGNGYSADFPTKTKVEKITAKPLPPKQNGITLAEAKKIAEQLLYIESDKVKLTIESVEEITNFNGQAVISIQYMYQFANGGHGTSIEINKNTGEIIQYNDITSEILEQLGEKPTKKNPIAQKEAQTQAEKYLTKWVPSYLHDYAKPVDEPYFDERMGSYYFTFPRVVNGIIVQGDQISVSIGADGSLYGLNVNYQEVEQWPSVDTVISEENAKSILKEELSLKLNYMKKDNKKDNHHYDLVYLPVFNEEPFSYLNANTGEWNSLYNENFKTVISHPWAEEELNYLINAKLIDIKDTKNFSGDASVSNGEALKIILNSLTHFYSGSYHGGRENTNQTFENIDSENPFYLAIERAVEMGIIQPNTKSFDFESPVKREELAVWYIRVLGLEQAAKHNSVYKLEFADANKVQKENIGYVALANSMGLVNAEQNHFNPEAEVTYAELAVSIIRLAHELSEKGNDLRY